MPNDVRLHTIDRPNYASTHDWPRTYTHTHPSNYSVPHTLPILAPQATDTINTQCLQLDYATISRAQAPPSKIKACVRGACCVALLAAAASSKERRTDKHRGVNLYEGLAHEWMMLMMRNQFV
jgi:hypothetical protein